MVRFQEKEMRKALRKKHAEKVWQGGHYDNVPNVEMKGWIAPRMSYPLVKMVE
jgi:hypothetical protein